MVKADTVIILDFETTGLSPDMGDRAIEIGAVRIENGIIKERFQELMNPSQRISSFIESYTGITNNMLDELDEQYDLQSIPFTLIQQLTKIPKKSVHDFLEKGQKFT